MIGVGSLLARSTSSGSRACRGTGDSYVGIASKLASYNLHSRTLAFAPWRSTSLQIGRCLGTLVEIPVTPARRIVFGAELDLAGHRFTSEGLDKSQCQVDSGRDAGGRPDVAVAHDALLHDFD